MANYTPNYNLKKPLDSENYDIADQNGNMDLIDTALNTQNQAIGNLSNLTTTAKTSAVDAINEINAGKTNRIRIQLQANGGTGEFTYSSETIVLAGARAWNTNKRQLTLISAYSGGAQRSNIDEIVGNQSVFTITPVTDSPKFILTNQIDSPVEVGVIVIK